MADKNKKIDLVGVLISVAIIWFVVILLRPSDIGIKKVKIKTISNPIFSKKEAKNRTLYDIDKIRPKESKAGKGAVRDLGSVYQNYPVGDAGEDMVAAWSKISVQEKQKLSSGLDGEIKNIRKQLVLNPEDRKAAAKLKVAESLKKLTANNFNYKPGD